MRRFLRTVILPFATVVVCSAVAIVLFIDWFGW